MSDDVLIDTAHEHRATALPHDAPACAPEPDDVDDRSGGADHSGGADRSRAGRVAREYAGLTAAVAAVVAVMVRPWVGGWSNPIVYGNDTLSHLAMLHGAGLTGTARGTSSLGAPYGLSWVDFPLGPDRVHLILVRLLRLVARDDFLAFNLYLLAGFFLVAWASFAVLRALRISPLVAGAISVVFTIAPYHFARLSDGHVFLAAYFAVPLGVLLALWANDESIRWRTDRLRAAVAIGCVLVVGSASAYYAVFSLVLIASLGLVLAVRRGSWRVLLVPLAMSVAVAGVVAANAAGDVWSNRSHGTNNEVSVRPASDSATFGLSLSQMVLPGSGHRIEALGQLGAEADESLDGGETGSAIGLLAVLGLLAIAVTCVRSFRGDRSAEDAAREPLMVRLGVLVLAAALVATVGSVSLLVALIGFGQIRVWSRMSIVIAYLGLVGLAVVLDRLVASPRVSSRQFGPLLLAIAVVAVGVLDQTSPGSLPERAFIAADRRVDEQVAQQMTDGLPAEARVFELPQTDFLFGLPDGDMPLYGLLGPWSVDPDALEYSAGAMEGRGGDWQRSWVLQPVEQMLPGIAAAGFDGVYLDRRSEEGGGATSGTAPAAAWLRDTLGEPSGVVPDRSSSREWYDLRPLRSRLIAELGADRVEALGAAVRRPIGVVYDGAVSRFAVSDGARLLRADSSITLRNEQAADAGEPSGPDTDPVRVRFELTGVEGSTVRIDAAGRSRDVILERGPTPVELELPLDARDTVIRLHTRAPRLSGVSNQLGDVRLQVSQPRVIDASLDDAVARGELTVD